MGFGFSAVPLSRGRDCFVRSECGGMSRFLQSRFTGLCCGTPPPPTLWTQIPLFYEVTARYARQNRLPIQLSRRIVLAKELVDTDPLTYIATRLSQRNATLRGFFRGENHCNSIVRQTAEITCKSAQRDLHFESTACSELNKNAVDEP